MTTRRTTLAGAALLLLLAGCASPPPAPSPQATATVPTAASLAQTTADIGCLGYTPTAQADLELYVSEGGTCELRNGGEVTVRRFVSAESMDNFWRAASAFGMDPTMSATHGLIVLTPDDAADLDSLRVKRLALAVAAALAISLGSTGAASAAGATTNTITNGGGGARSCATVADYNRVHSRQTRSQVNAILHNTGRQRLIYPIPRIPVPLVGRIIRYPVCAKDGWHYKAGAWIDVYFQNVPGRTQYVTAKRARW